MNKFISEFKEFISKGNVVDMAVGIIVGTAFTAIVNSLVNQVIMPPIGYLLGRVDFSDLKYTISRPKGEVPGVYISYGAFIQQVINFIIIAFVVFCMVKMLNMLRNRRQEEKEKAEKEAPKPELQLLTEIRDLLKESRK